MIERAVVLAAGRGARLGPLTEQKPKALIEVGGRPLINHVLEGIRSAGIYEVVVVTGYLATSVEDHVWGTDGMSITFARQESPGGTGHALSVASEYVRERRFLYSWADVLVDSVVYSNVIAAAADSEAVIAVNAVEDPWAGAAVTVDDQGWVKQIVEKPAPGTSTTTWNNSRSRHPGAGTPGA